MEVNLKNESLVSVTNVTSTLLSACFDLSLNSSHFIDEWNHDLMNELMTNRGCSCQDIVETNGLHNLFCAIRSLEHSWLVQVVYIILFGLIITMAIGGNSIVIWIVLAHKQMRTVTNYFLLNLALADASISLFNVCFNFVYILYYNWWFGDLYCYFSNLMGVAPTCASVFTLMSMSVDRYVAIMNPLRKRMSRHKTIATIVVIWIAAFLCALPMFLHSYTKKFFFENGDKRSVCYADNYPDGDAKTSAQFKIYNYFLLFITYILPLGVLSFTFIRMARVLWGGKTIGEHRQESQICAKRKVVKMLTVVGSLFMVCWLPYHIYFTFLVPLFAEMDFLTAQHVYMSMYWLAMSSTVVNPIIYCWMNSRFRTGFRYIFRWLPCVQMTKGDYLLSELNEKSHLTRRLKNCSRSGVYNGSLLLACGKDRRTVTRKIFETNDCTSSGAACPYRSPPLANYK
ncbi:Tachykinin-like peptides receptor 99D [Trichinella sp. T6]|nr:Tachykinin-like peptides receptor 99D [Trichinella sp. T6]